MNYDRRAAIEYKPLTPEVKAKIAQAAKDAGVAATVLQQELTKLKGITDAVWKILDAHYGHRGGTIETAEAPRVLQEFAFRDRQLKNNALNPEMFDVWKLVYAIADLKK